MNIIFKVPADLEDAIIDIRNQCSELYIIEERELENLSGDQVIAIIAIAAPVVWDLVKKYLFDPKVTIEIQHDEKTTVIISDRSYERAIQKYESIRKEAEKLNTES